MLLKKHHRFLLSLGTAILLSAGFPYIGSLPVISFFAFIPLLILEEHIFTKRLRARKFFWHTYLCFVLFNALTCWWVYFASAGGVILAVFANAALMMLPWMLFHWTKKFVGAKEGYITLPFFWLAFEYFHFHWELSWPWLTLGNTFSIVPSWVQWYEFTGVMGGTLWIFVANLLLFHILKNVWGRKQSWQYQRSLIVFWGVVVLVPIFLSYLLLGKDIEGDKKMEVVVVQPNVDPYNEKFQTSARTQLNKIINLAQKKITPETDFVVAPETALTASIRESKLKKSKATTLLQEFLDTTNSASWVIGASTYAAFDQKHSPASKKHENGKFYENYNTALHIQKKKGEVSTYHKSKLVLGVEYLPFAWLLKPIESWAIDLGGTSGSLGIEKEPKVFQNNGFSIIPAICYESVYGAYLGSFSRKNKVDALFIITNDGWWEDTPGYKQHFSFARLRAIEMRKSVVRSANTGWSGIIDPYGAVKRKTQWWEPDVFRYTVLINTTKTLYMRYGNILGRTSAFVVGLVIVLMIVQRLRKLGSKTPYGGRSI